MNLDDRPLLPINFYFFQATDTASGPPPVVSLTWIGPMFPVYFLSSVTELPLTMLLI